MINANTPDLDVDYTTQSLGPMFPPGTDPELKHYRLVYESAPDPDTNVKTFEHVEGAVIPGEGVVEATVVTNTGREFVDRQASENGTFVFTYSTTGNSYDVKMVGGYRIAGGTGDFTVTEEAARGGAWPPGHRGAAGLRWRSSRPRG
ncbi:MAG: hypothetical protein M0P21_05150 [Methanoculleus sp.]|nr:hypothetical protein [Methanoculleus sp.]